MKYVEYYIFRGWNLPKLVYHALVAVHTMKLLVFTRLMLVFGSDYWKFLNEGEPYLLEIYVKLHKVCVNVLHPPISWVISYKRYQIDLSMKKFHLVMQFFYGQSAHFVNIYKFLVLENWKVLFLSWPLSIFQLQSTQIKSLLEIAFSFKKLKTLKKETYTYDSKDRSSSSLSISEHDRK